MKRAFYLGLGKTLLFQDGQYLKTNQLSIKNWFFGVCMCVHLYVFLILKTDRNQNEFFA